MSPSVVSNDRQATTATRPLWRPEETFWQRYSPHHEFPVATVSALTLCGVAVGLLFLLWLLGGFVNTKADGPPRVDVVNIPGPEGGGGLGGLDSGGTPLAAKEHKKELIANAGQVKATLSRPIVRVTPLPNKLKDNDLAVAPATEPDLPSDPSPFQALQQDLKQAEREFNIAAEREAARKAGTGPKNAVGDKPGGGNRSGSGGGTGGGIGPGHGVKVGPGAGARAATRQEILAWRWRFDLQGAGSEHANKLVAMGVTLAVMAPDGKFYVIRDLKKRPVDLTPADMSQHKDEVKWYNTRADSLRNLAATLGLRFQPRFVVMLLPRDREQKMAQVEHDYMQAHGLQTVQGTWFDFPAVNGVYEPVVTRIE